MRTPNFLYLRHVHCPRRFHNVPERLMGRYVTWIRLRNLPALALKLHIGWKRKLLCEYLSNRSEIFTAYTSYMWLSIHKLWIRSMNLPQFAKHSKLLIWFAICYHGNSNFLNHWKFSNMLILLYHHISHCKTMHVWILRVQIQNGNQSFTWGQIFSWKFGCFS